MVKSIGRGSNFALTYAFNPINFTQSQTNGTTGKKDSQSGQGLIELAKIDQTTVIVLASIFGTLGALIAIALLIYFYGLLKAWVKSKWKTDVVQPLPMETDIAPKDGGRKKGFESDRRTLKQMQADFNKEGGEDPTRPTTVGDIERAKWKGSGGLGEP